jgi:hypothetical protein
MSLILEELAVLVGCLVSARIEEKEIQPDIEVEMDIGDKEEKDIDCRRRSNRRFTKQP